MINKNSDMILDIEMEIGKLVLLQKILGNRLHYRLQSESRSIVYKPSTKYKYIGNS